MDYDSEVYAVCEILSEVYEFHSLNPAEREKLRQVMTSIDVSALRLEDMGYFSGWPFKMLPKVVINYCSSLLGFDCLQQEKGSTLTVDITEEKS